jgi:5-methyltetrahydropteroyltriglutamate--homocysteine methyltransferase
MKRSAERILTTHAGSLIRPPELLELAHRRPTHGLAGERAYEDCLRHSVAEVVRRQAEAGVDVVSDGEFGKSGFHVYTTERLAGIEIEPATGQGPSWPGEDAARFPDFYREQVINPQSPTLRGPRVVTGPISYIGQAAMQRDIDNFKAALQQVHVEEAFLPVIAPGSVLSTRAFEPDVDRYYPDSESFLFALAGAMHVEYQMIVDAGLLVQIDDPSLPLGYDRMLPDITIDAYREWCELRIAALNRALEGIPPDRVRYHICWGSWNAPHTTDVPLKHIADLVLKVNAGAYSIEAANPRHEHEWRVWEQVKLPEGKILIPGVVTHSTNIVEHPELVAERIVRFAHLAGRESVMAGTDCGFAQIQEYQRVHPSIMWAKLQALAEGARLASRQLWG